MNFHSWHNFICIGAFLTCTMSAAVSADPIDFFPSTRSHEDGRIAGDFHLKVNNCQFELAHYSPNFADAQRITITTFDLAYFETSPRYVNIPFASAPLSSRHFVGWFAKAVTAPTLAETNATLRSASLSFRESRKLDTAEMIDKRARLNDIMAAVQAGDFGEFAARNLTRTYVVVDAEPELISLYTSPFFQLPTKRNLAPELVDEMDNYRAANCDDS